MRHRIKKIKFRGGVDATQATVKKMVRNFILEGTLTTSVKRAKLLRSLIDRYVNRAKNKKNTGKMSQIVETFAGRTGGYVKIARLGTRLGDGAEMAKAEWTLPIIQVQSPPVKVSAPKLKVEKKPDGKLNKPNKASKRKRN